MKRSLWISIMVAVVLAAGLVAGFRHFGAVAAGIPTVQAKRGEFLVTLQVRGTIASRRSVELHAPNVSGLQIVWLAPNGSVVEAGKPVVRFDSSIARQQMSAKTAALHQAQAALDQAQATARLDAQQDQLDLATAQTTAQSAALDASKQAILSPIDGAEAKLALDMAQEKLRVEQAAIAAHQAADGAKIASAQSKRDKAQADLSRVQDQLQQMEVVTPITGVVSYLMNYSQGYVNAQTFRAGDSVWPTAEIGEVPDLGTLDLEAKVPEIDRGRLKIGDAVRVHLDALPELDLTGHVRAVSALAEADFSGVWPPPQIFGVDCDIDPISTGKLDPRLRPEMNGSIDIITQRLPDAISIPAAAVFPINGRPAVYAQHGGKFLPQPVTILAHNADYDAISGVPAGARLALTDPTRPEKQP